MTATPRPLHRVAPFGLLSAIAVSLAIPGPALAAPGPGSGEEVARIDEVPELDGLRERWAAAMPELGVPGCAIAVLRDRELLALDALGIRNPDGDPVDADTMFYVASCTKTFTAAALAVLAEAGRVDLDEPIQVYLPRFELRDPDMAALLTIGEALCHLPGLNSFPIVFQDAYTGQITEDRYWHWMSRVEPLGTVRYTNVHYTLAGRVLEAVEGKSWKDVLEERLFQPAGMTRTTAYASRMYSDPNVAFPMEGAPGAYTACATRKTDRTMHAAGGTGTTARDAARWLLVQLRDGEVDGRRVFSEDTALHSRELLSEIEPSGTIRRQEGFGLAWSVGDLPRASVRDPRGRVRGHGRPLVVPARGRPGGRRARQRVAGGAGPL